MDRINLEWLLSGCFLQNRVQIIELVNGSVFVNKGLVTVPECTPLCNKHPHQTV